MREVVCIRCIDPVLKDELLKQVDDPGLRALPKCGDGSPIGFAVAPGDLVRAPKPGDVQRGPRQKRAPSAYNIFIGSCMKAKTGVAFPERMKSCAIEYKAKKGM